MCCRLKLIFYVVFVITNFEFVISVSSKNILYFKTGHTNTYNYKNGKLVVKTTPD